MMLKKECWQAWDSLWQEGREWEGVLRFKKRREAHSLFSLSYSLTLSNFKIFISLFLHSSKYLLSIYLLITYWVIVSVSNSLPSWLPLLSLLLLSVRLPNLPSYISVFSSSLFCPLYLPLSCSLSLLLPLSLSFFHPLVQSLALFSTSIPTINSVPSSLSSSLLYAPSIPPPLPRSLFPHTLLISANLKNYVPFFIPLPPLARSLRSAVRYFWTLFCCLCRLW